jgi:hypothetical protein
MASPSITLDRILAAVPITTRGQPTQISADSKGQRIAYPVRRGYIVHSPRCRIQQLTLVVREIHLCSLH